MSTAQKPEALRLADKFEVDGFLSDHTFAQNQWCSQAAVELRRLHAENLELRAQNDFFEAIKSMLDARTGLDAALKKYGANQESCDGGKCGIGGYCAECPKQKKSDGIRSDALCDLAYCAGLKAGWNFCVSDDHAGFERAQSRGAEALRELKSSRQSLTENEMHQEIVALSERLFDARIGKSCSQCEGGTYQADHNGYSRFHRCNKCHYVPIWGEDGCEFGMIEGR